jgi:hypothetical protein
MRKIKINLISVSDRNDLKPNFLEQLRHIRQNRILKMVAKEMRINLMWESPNKNQGTTDSVTDVVPQ